MSEIPLEEKFLRLVQIMDKLREECPWDQQQTIHTLRAMTLEEVYELADAIINENWSEIKEELGDILLHILFYARIATEEKKFSLEEVIADITEKMIVRHPHIYAHTKVENAEDVKKNWQKIKLKGGKSSVLEGVPKGLPALIKSLRIQEKARQTGFDWQHKEEVWQKVEEEISELHAAQKKNNQCEIEEEFGDLMFTMINYARFLQVDAEAALEKANRKFMHRFTQMEEMASTMGTTLTDMNLQELENLWQEAKKIQTK